MIFVVKGRNKNMNEYVVVKDIHLPLTDNSLEDVVIKKVRYGKKPAKNQPRGVLVSVV